MGYSTVVDSLRPTIHYYKQGLQLKEYTIILHGGKNCVRDLDAVIHQKVSNVCRLYAEG